MNKEHIITGAGFICADIIKIGTDEQFMLGGTAGNVLTILSQLGEKVAFFSAKYCDDWGNWLEKSLENSGIKPILYSQSRIPAPRVVEMLDIEGQSHYFQTVCPSCGRKINRVVLPNRMQVQKMLDKPPICNLFFYDRISDGIRELAETNQKGWNYYEPNACRTYQVFLRNAQSANIVKFSEERLPIIHLDNLITDLNATQISLVIVTKGKNGIQFSYRENDGNLSEWQEISIESEPLGITDESGAGDWLSASFIFWFLKEYPYVTRSLDNNVITKILKRAQKIATMQCGFVGAQGMLYDQRAIKKLNEIFGVSMVGINTTHIDAIFDCSYCKTLATPQMDL